MIALALLTRIPTPWRGEPATAHELGWSVLFYPVIGALIGLLIAAFVLALPSRLDAGLCAALVICAWVWLTGGMHLEGLADTADGWVGGLGNPARGLEIMRDPRSGPAALMAITLTLLLKWNLGRMAIASGDPSIWLIAPLLGRLSIVLLFVSTPYVRAGGMGEVAAQQLPKVWGLVVGGGGGIVAGWLGSLWIVMVAGVVWLVLRRAWLKRFGGVTGDLAGATCELVETVVMLSWVW
ncbi:MAG: adenosylcobinamide-GDP ribazoletransferase [Magnetococcales bacterium]|nr:adenosylcobinamide-GDP ribazoletransferase [Magnetococcales bacterium]